MKLRLKTRVRLLRRILKRFLTRKLSTRLVVTYIALGALPLITISVFLITLSHQTVKTYIYERNLETARRASNEIFLFIEGPLTILQTTAMTGDITQMEKFSQSKLINKIKDENPIFRKIFIVDTSGLGFNTTSFGEDMKNFRQEPFFEQSIRGKEFVSDVYFSPSRFPILLISEPIKVYNKILGVLAAEIDLKSIWDLIDNIRIGKTGYAFLISEHGTVIAHKEKETVLEKQNFSNYQFFQELKERKQGISNFVEDETKMIAAFAPVQRLNWGIIVQQSEKEAFTLAQQMQLRVYVLVAITIVIALLLGFLSVQRITKPLIKLVGGARQFAKGNLEHQIVIERKDELAELAQEFNAMAYSLQKIQSDLKKMTRLAALSRFASLVSHEIRNPLNSMNINMQVLKRLINKNEISLERKIKYLNILSSEISRINDLVNNFLAIARPPELNFDLSELHEIMNEVILIQDAHAVSEGVGIARNYARGEIWGMFDYNQLKQVFHNIIINAIDAMREGGQLIIKTSVVVGKNEDDLSVRILFKDSGIGIPENAISDVFEFYYTTKQTGTGLGLAIAKQIIEGHKGDITIESEEGTGTSIIISLPIKSHLIRQSEISQNI